MSKRKVTAGGYEESSDGLEPEVVLASQQPTKKLKSAPFAPLRLSAAPKAGGTSFQLPRSQSSSARSSVTPGPVTSSSLPRTLPSGAALPVLHVTPGSQGDQMILDETASNLELDNLGSHGPSANAKVNLKAAEHAPRPNTDPLQVLTKSAHARSTISHERQLNELRSSFEDFVTSSEEQHRRTNETLSSVLEAISRLAPAENAAFAPALGRPISMSPAFADTKPYHSNPVPTPELIATVSKVVSATRNRVGKKKGGSEDNSLKEHTRITFYRMLGIMAAKAVQPYFEDEHGEPDTLPVQFTDPETKYCQPYPHWKAPLTKQVAWVPTYILRFRSTIPNDHSDLSNLLRNLSDEQIVALLNDGPFRSAQTAWRDLKKTDEELEVMRGNARKYQRTERKATTRGRYIKMIPSLQGPEWEYLSHPGYMSQDESDDEGGLVTRQPNHRSQWETNLYDAIRIAQLNKARAQPGLCPRPPRRTVEVVKRPIPHLERGTGSSKVTIRIALCGISKLWREQHSGDLQKYAHLINTKAAAKPDISAFLSQHPMPDDDDNNNDFFDNGDDRIDQWGMDGEVMTQFGAGDGGSRAKDSPSIGGDEGAGTGECNREGDGDGGNGDRRGTGVDEGEGEGEGEDSAESRARTSGGKVSEGSSPKNHVEIPIDPQLTHTLDNNTVLGRKIRPHPKQQGSNPTGSASSVPAAERQTPVELVEPQAVPEPVHDSRPPAHYSQMPPPPPLQPKPHPTPNNITVNNQEPKARTRRAKQPKDDTVASGVTLTQGGSTQSQPSAVESGAPPAKRRGRPPGSKNKPKA